jgi:hypothetical protein
MIWEAIIVSGIVAVLAVMLADYVRAQRQSASEPLPPVPGAYAPPVIKPLPSLMPGVDLTEADRERRAPAGMTLDELSALLDDGDETELDHLMMRLEGRTFDIEGNVTSVEFDKLWITVTLKARSRRRIDVSIYFPTSMSGRFAQVTSGGWSIRAEAAIYVSLSGLRPAPNSMTFYQPTLIELARPEA